MYKITEL